MMFRTILTVGILSCLFMPVPAGAYMSPESVLNDDDFSTRFLDPPPSRRALTTIKEEEAEAAAERRDAELSAIQNNGLEDEEQAIAGETSDDGTHAAAPIGNSGDLSEIMNAIDELKNKETTAAELRDERMLQRIKLQQEEARLRAQLPVEIQRLMAGEALHSGAPLSDTGSATIIALFVLGAAALWTLWHVRHMERKNAH